MSNFFNGNQEQAYRIASTDEALIANTIVKRVFLWMFYGVAVTALGAYFLLNTAAGQQALMSFFKGFAGFGGTFIFLALQIGLVLYINTRINKLSSTGAAVAFTLYSAMMAFLVAMIAVAYGLAVIYQAFVAAAVLFAVCAIMGAVTKRDLTNLGSIAFSALIAMIIVTIINVFLKSPFISYVISYVGVVIFAILTAYDVQRIKNMAHHLALQDGENALIRSKNFAIIAALSLYLDFINMFFYLVRIFGSRN